MARQLVTSLDLAAYFVSTRRDAQELLPLVVRRLIVATTIPGTLGSLTIPAGDDIRLTGWDGRVESASRHPYIPTGASAWEMGVGQDPELKADSDFKKRTAAPAGVDPTATTFVFVTPNVWAGKDAWIAARRAEGAWLDVRVVDGQVLSEWFDLAPAVAVWFNNERGTPVAELDDVDTSWRRNVLTPLTKPATPALIIGGRDQEAATLRAWLADPRDDLAVTAESADEVVCFVDAVVLGSESGPVAVDLAPRTLIARGAGAIHHLGALHSPHIVVVADPTLVPDLRSARLRNVHLVVPQRNDLGGAAERPGSRLDLPPLRREAIERELSPFGYRPDEAARIARESRGSLQAVLWALGHSGLQDLPWLQEPAASLLAPLVLARRWTVAEHPDHTAVARLADREYRDVFVTAAEWRKPGGPLQVAGKHWDWKAWRVAWEHLAPHFTHDLMERFSEVALRVLGTRDPALDLAPEDRWMKSLRNKTHQESTQLREGLVSSIAMLAVRGDRLRDMDGPGIAAGLVRTLLDTESLSDSWLSLGPWLPDLAEAAPEVFLAAAERVVEDRAVLTSIFTEGGMFGSSPHTYLLWALERLAWSPELVSRVAVLLGRLAEADPGGRLANRPKNSLREILLPWHPGTAASLSQRLDAFDHVSSRCPDAAWRCSLALLPSDHDVSSPSAEPQFRDWRPADFKQPSMADYREFTESLVDRVITMAGHLPQRWEELVRELPVLFRSVPAHAGAAANALMNLDARGWSNEERLALAEGLRELIQHHEEFPEADWALEPAELEVLRPLAKKFESDRARDQHRWLFVANPRGLGNRKATWKEEQDEVTRARVAAVEAVRVEEGLRGVVDWSKEVESPEALGATLAELVLTDEEEIAMIDETLISGATDVQWTTNRRFGDGFVRRREQRVGSAWGAGHLQRIREAGPRDAAVRFALSLAPSVDLWKALDDMDRELAARYWTQASLRFLRIEEAEVALSRLIEAGRPYTAISLAALLTHDTVRSKSGEDSVARVLALCELVTRQLPQHDPAAELGAPSLSWLAHSVSEVLAFIEEHAGSGDDVERLLVNWEWHWLPVLEHSGRGLRALCRQLARSPELFVELLQLVYRAKGEAVPDEPATPETPSSNADQRRLRARQAWKLLEAWHVVPGLDLRTARPTVPASAASSDDAATKPAVEGTVDEKALGEWIDSARRLAGDCDRLDLCDSHIGKVLAFAPADEDGAWPCAPVRQRIERLASQRLESGLAIAIHNRRGVHYVGPTGAPERKMRDAYRAMAAKLERDSPRTAAVLRSVADGYETAGKQRDAEGRRDEFRDL
ncbi:MAG: hypothetical protein KF745_02675 [Phycisphaeraceae bacterium]|nr:hypothetical protein [Phycisphaeraceae bacterium]